MKRVPIQIAAFLLLTILVKAQAPPEETSTEKIPLSLSTYNINGVNPGLKIGADYPLKELIKQKVKRNNKTKTINKLWYLNGSMAFGIEPTSNTNWLTSLEIGRLRTRNHKWFASPTFGLGALVRFNNGETWEVKDGEVTNIGNTSRTYFAPNIGMTFGRNYSIKDFEFGVFGRGNGVLAVGMNNTKVPLFSFELGLRCAPPFTFTKSKHIIKKVTK